MKILVICLAFTLYSFFHSLFASRRIKTWFETNFPKIKAFYRLIYTIIQTVLFLIMIIFLPRPSGILWEVKGIVYWIFRMLQLAGLVGFFWAARSFNLKEFVGLQQTLEFFKSKSSKVEMETPEFHTNGAFAYMRHPLYSFTTLIFLFEPQMNVFKLLFLIWLIIYFWIGSILEEKRMIEQFGEPYREYQRSVNRFLPKIKKIIHWNE